MQVNIQLLRFIVTMAVVLCHVADHYTAAGGTGFPLLLQYLPIAGHIGVDTFFVISGYILWVTTRNSSGPLACAQFLYRRATRIYFGYWPFLILVVVMYWAYSFQFGRPIDIWGSIFLTQNQSQLLILPVSWTLSYEILFYICLAVILLLPKQFRVKALIIWFLLFCIAMILLWLVFNGYLPRYNQVIMRVCSFSMSSYSLDFIGGCFLAYYLEKGLSINLIVCTLLLFILSGIMAVYKTHGAENALLDYPYKRAAVCGIAAIMLVAISVGLEKCGKIFHPAASLLLGNATYSIYLSHTILLEWFYFLGWRTAAQNGAFSPGLFVVISTLIILAYSIWHYLSIESPLTKLSQAFAKKIFKH